MYVVKLYLFYNMKMSHSLFVENIYVILLKLAILSFLK